MFYILRPLCRDRVIAQFLDYGVVANACVLWVAVATLHSRDARGYTEFSVIVLSLSLYLVEPFCVILLTSSQETAVLTIDVVKTTTTDTACYSLVTNEIVLGEAILVDADNACRIKRIFISLMECDSLRRTIDIYTFH